MAHVIFEHLGAYNYEPIQLMLSCLYNGFKDVEYTLSPGHIFYTSINVSIFNKDEYHEGKIMYWPKLVRGSTNPNVALAFSGKKGAVIAVELDYGLPHFHVKISTILKSSIIHPAGVYLFPWFCFKIAKVIEMDDIFLIKVTQTPWPKEHEINLTMNELKKNENIDYSSVRLYKEINADVKDIAAQNLMKSTQGIAKIYGQDIADELMDLDKNTKISKSGWEC